MRPRDAGVRQHLETNRSLARSFARGSAGREEEGRGVSRAGLIIPAIEIAGKIRGRLWEDARAASCEMWAGQEVKWSVRDVVPRRARFVETLRSMLK